MKILTLISGGDAGGAKTHVLSLLAGLGKTETVTLVCFMEGEFSRDARAMGIDTRVMTDKNLLRVLRDIRALIRSGGYQLIHSHGSRGNFLAWLLKGEGIPLLSTVHSDTRLDYMGRPFANMTYGVLNRIALRRMDYLTGVSDSMTELLISRGFSPDRTFTIYNGVDLHIGEPKISRAELFRSHGIPEEPGAVYVGIAARLNPVKDVETLIRGFAAAVREQPALRLLIAGDGQQENMLKKLAADLGVGDRVFFLGWIEDTDSFYAALDINALTSLSETFPYALTEGARRSRATVSSRVGGVPKLIDHGVNGLMFPAGDREALAECLIRLGGDAELRRTMGQRLYEKTKRIYSLDVTIETQKEIYQAVLRRFYRETGKRDAVAVCGAYGRGNAGDEAILRAIVAEIRETDPDIPIWVVSRKPRETRQMHRVRAIHTYDVPAFLRLSRRICLYLNGGGSLIQDVTSRRSLWFYLFTLWAAHREGIPVVMYGCGIGPVRLKRDRRIAGRVISKNVDVITLREDSSLRELRDLGVSGPEVLLAADPSLTLPAESTEATEGLMRSAGLDPEGNYVAFVLRMWPGIQEKAAEIARAAERLYREEGLTAVFLPVAHIKDNQAAELVIRSVHTPVILLNGRYGGTELAALLSGMRAVISMRLHGLIFAAGHGVPLVGIVYDPKVRAFLRYIGQSRDVDLEDVTEETLVRLTREAVAGFSPAAQQQAVRKLCEMEGENRRVLRSLLERNGTGG